MTIPSPTVTPAGSPQSEKFRTLPVRMTTEFWARSVATILADPKTDTDCRQRLTGELQSIADAAARLIASAPALLAAAEAALPLLLLAAINAPDRECAKRYSDTCSVVTAAIKAAKGGVA